VTYLIRRIDSTHTFADFRTQDTTVYEPLLDRIVGDEELAFDPPDAKSGPTPR